MMIVTLFYRRIVRQRFALGGRKLGRRLTFLSIRLLQMAALETTTEAKVAIEQRECIQNDRDTIEKH